MKKIASEAAFVLHHYDWSESSLMLEVFTRNQGRLTLVAKGAKRPASNFRSVLLPLLRLEIAYTMPGDAEIGTLRGAEWAGAYTLPKGDALLAGYYANELLLRLVPRADAHPLLFDAYGTVVTLLAMQGKAWIGQGQPVALAENTLTLEPALMLRAFELVVLRELGVLPALDTTASGHAIAGDDQQQWLSLNAQRGLVYAGPEQALEALPAQLWRQLHAALDQPSAIAALLMVLHGWSGVQRTALRNQLRQVLQWHLQAPLRTRQFLRDIYALDIPEKVSQTVAG